MKTVKHNRLLVLQWETIGQQIANSINNMPIGLRTVSITRKCRHFDS